ncbi:hypothetical protein [Bifidobacterium sp. SO1]|uniref:hypothetical protein n=1 Tax=Bifidobacterium sp. SO1 TaxID=2809029 RepID=UPI001BDBCB02|nr:hypothetical protein [Bifidobacterium sp. SO1]MBT1160909.1 hypothetical protein [Bifidobacterium sp. SO1]
MTSSEIEKLSGQLERLQEKETRLKARRQQILARQRTRLRKAHDRRLFEVGRMIERELNMCFDEDDKVAALGQALNVYIRLKDAAPSRIADELSSSMRAFLRDWEATRKLAEMTESAS